MTNDDPNRRTHISCIVGGGFALPPLDTEAGHEHASSPAQVNRPLVVTSEAN